jgi:hypothetical protein
MADVKDPKIAEGEWVESVLVGCRTALELAGEARSGR